MSGVPPATVDFSTLVQVTAELGWHVETLIRNEIYDNPARVAKISPSQRTLQSPCTVSAYLKRCVDVGDASVQIARCSITLLASLNDAMSVENATIATGIQQILTAIDNARVACVNFRLAGSEVDKRGSGRGIAMLRGLSEYTFEIERASVTIEPNLLKLEKWWSSASVSALKALVSDTAVMGEFLSAHSAHIAHICIYAHPFRNYFELPSALDREFQSLMRFEDMYLRDAEMQIQLFFGCDNSRIRQYEMDCFLKQDAVFAFLAALKAQSERSTTEALNPLLTAIKSSMTSALGHLYGVLISSIKKELWLYKIRTTDTPEFLRNFSSGLQMLVDLHNDFHERLQQSTVDIKLLESLVDELQTQLDIYTARGEGHITFELECRKCWLLNFVQCLLEIQRNFGGPGPRRLCVKPGSQQTGHSSSYRSATHILSHIFDWDNIDETRRSFLLFDEHMYNVQLDAATVAPQWCHEHPGFALSLSLEEAYHLLPSLRELVNMHYDVYCILQCEMPLRRPDGEVETTQSRQPVRWLLPVPTISGASAKTGFSRSWGPLPPHLQRLFSDESKAVKKSWSQSSRISGQPANTLSQQQGESNPPKNSATSQSAGFSKAKETRMTTSLQGDWSF